MNFPMTSIKAMQAAKLVGQPVWKILAGLVTQLSKVKLLAYFGAAMPRLKSATEEGDLEYGMQFVGQTQGLINDIPEVNTLLQRIINEAHEISHNNSSYF